MAYTGSINLHNLCVGTISITCKMQLKTTRYNQLLQFQRGLKLEKLVVPNGVEKNPQLIAACREKGVTLV